MAKPESLNKRENSTPSPKEQQELTQNSLNLLQTVLDLEISLLSNSQTEDPNTATSIDTIIDSLETIDTPAIVLITPFARMPRETDRVKHTPGQHKGFRIQFVLKTGHIINLNVYGALRRISGKDKRDTLSAHANHSDRTEHIASQATHINLHLDEYNTHLWNLWLIRMPNGQFVLGDTFLNYQSIKPQNRPTLNLNDYGYQNLSDRLAQSINALIQLIPSAS